MTNEINLKMLPKCHDTVGSINPQEVNSLKQKTPIIEISFLSETKIQILLSVSIRFGI